MIIVNYESKGKKKEETYNTKEEAVHHLKTQGYVYDEIDDYYWRLNIRYGWMMKARLSKKRQP